MVKDDIKRVIENALIKLVEKDSNIISNEIIEYPRISSDAKELNRKLHEVTINHRFAKYIEDEILKYPELNGYYTDIEYNRRYNNLKLLVVNNREINVRPDIIVHSRTRDDLEYKNILVIEAKKEISSMHDKNKVLAFLNDPNYNYLFGLTVSYCYNPRAIDCILYYLVNGVIEEDHFIVAR